MPKDILAIVGSRHFPEHLAILRARQIIEGVLERQRPDVIISGGAAGIDTLAESVAHHHGIEFWPRLPRYRRWAPEGYMERNEQIAQECTRLLCIRSRSATTYGSGWTADRARALGKLVWNVEI